MRTAVCTISSHSHLFKADALFHSLRGDTGADLIHLVIDSGPASPNDARGVMLRGLSSLTVRWAAEILGSYRGDALRWGCKPLLIGQLLEEGYDRVIYVDNDICFFSSPDPLFEMLDAHAVLLTPHFYPADPTRGQHWLEANFRVGLYNAGFVAAGQNGRGAMEWWAACCAYSIRKSAWRGLFDDQKYLDLLPVIFDGVHVLRHRGCNVAGWNIDMCPRTVSADGSVIIDGRWPLVFVHFNSFTVRAILKGRDPLLAPLMRQYEGFLQMARPGHDLRASVALSIADVPDFLRHLLWRFATTILR